MPTSLEHAIVNQISENKLFLTQCDTEIQNAVWTLYHIVAFNEDMDAYGLSIKYETLESINEELIGGYFIDTYGKLPYLDSENHLRFVII